MIDAELTGNRGTARGLTQWDYGQILSVAYEIPDGSEVNFYQGSLSSMAYMHGKQVKIPDYMLQNATAITAYIYIRKEECGETVLTIWLPIVSRPRPDNYILPDMEEYKRLLPLGGEPGQVPVRISGEGYVTTYEYRADGMIYDGEYVQLMSGEIPIGERVRIMKEEREIELTNDGTNIKWRYTDSNDWTVLVSMQSLTGPQGPPGITPEFEIRNGHLFVRYEKEGEQ